MQNFDFSTIPHATYRPREDEVVEDSEPEIEALRQTMKLERKRRKLAMKEVALSVPIIDISDSSIASSPLESLSVTKSASSSRVIAISDSSMSNVDIGQAAHTPSPTRAAPRATTPLDSSIPNLSPISLPHTQIIELDSDPHDDDLPPPLNLARFAYNNPRPLQSRASSSTILSSSSSIQVIPEPPVKAGQAAAKKRVKIAPADFSEAELAKLLKCVSCDLAWTVRKGSVQKLAHIRSCSKKNGYSQEVVAIMIQNWLDITPPAGSSSSKGKGKATSAVVSTLLDEVVKGAAPKRKAKRQRPVNHIKDASENNVNILHRAKTLLGGKTAVGGSSFPIQTQAVEGLPDHGNLSDDEDMAVDMPPATQAFGPSNLASRLAVRGTTVQKHFSGGEASGTDVPPATQPFAPSRLGSRLAGAKVKRGGWGYDSDSDDDDALPVQSDSSAFLKSIAALSVNDRSPKNSPKTKRCRSPKPVPIGDQTADSAILHYEPTQTPIVQPAAKKPRAKRKKAMEDEFGEKWESDLRTRIMDDWDLYQRILRYEPIHFDTFLRIAGGDDKCSGRFRVQLRNFLDKQAISFHGETIRNRR